MKNALLISNSYPIQPRIKKIASLIEKNGYKCIFVGWNLSGEKTNDPFVYDSPVSYGKPFHKLIDSINYIKFIKKIIKEIDISLVYCFTFDAMFCCWSFKSWPIIYDVADLPNVGVWYIDVLLSLAEIINKKRANVILLGSRFFVPLYEKYIDKIYVVENLPDFNYPLCERTTSTKVRITFLGVFRYIEILKNMIVALDDDEFIIQLYGFGKDEEKLKEFINEKGYKNVYFMGKYTEDEIPSIYARSELIWAVYPSKKINEKLAISNKYFESIYYKVPCIFDYRSNVGKLAEKNESGFCVDGYSVSSIKNTVKMCYKKKYSFNGQECTSFSKYQDVFMEIENKLTRGGLL